MSKRQSREGQSRSDVPWGGGENTYISFRIDKQRINAVIFFRCAMETRKPTRDSSRERTSPSLPGLGKLALAVGAGAAVGKVVGNRTSKAVLLPVGGVLAAEEVVRRAETAKTREGEGVAVEARGAGAAGRRRVRRYWRGEKMTRFAMAEKGLARTPGFFSGSNDQSEHS